MATFTPVSKTSATFTLYNKHTVGIPMGLLLALTYPVGAVADWTTTARTAFLDTWGDNFLTWAEDTRTWNEAANSYTLISKS